MVAPREDGFGRDLRAVGRSAFVRSEPRPRPDRGRRPARVWPYEEEAGRHQLAAATAARVAKSFARAPDPDRACGGKKEVEARRPDRGRFLSRPDQPGR